MFVAFYYPDARAQGIFDGDQYRDQNDPFKDRKLVGVRERPHPELEPAGIAIGDFTVHPQAVQSIAYDSNLLALTEAEGDVALTSGAIWEMRSREPRNRFKVAAGLNLIRHIRREQENHETFFVKLEARDNLSSRYSASFSAGYAQLAEARTADFASPNGFQPTIYTRVESALSIQSSFGRLLWRASVGVLNFDYQDSYTDRKPVTHIDETDRNREIYGIGLDVEYSLSPSAAVFASGRGNTKNFQRSKKMSSVDRDTRGFEITGGFRFNPIALIELAASGGYLEQYYQSPLRNVRGFSADIRLKWLPTQLTTVEIQASRSVEEGGAFALGNAFANRLKLRVSHELKRNILVDCEAGYRLNDFSQLDRKDRRYFLGAGVTFRTNRNFTLNARYRLLDQNSRGSNLTRDFRQSRLAVSLGFRV